MTATGDTDTDVEPMTEAEARAELSLLLDASRSIARAWRCIKFGFDRDLDVMVRRAARELVDRRIHQHFKALRNFWERSLTKARLTTTVATWALALMELWATWMWWEHVSPWLSWAPIVTSVGLTIPATWRIRAVVHRRMLESDKLGRTITRHSTTHTADYRDRTGTEGDGMGNAAQRQVVERIRRREVATLGRVERTKSGWKIRIFLIDGMSAKYFNEWQVTASAGIHHRWHMERDADDAGSGTLWIVRRDPLRGPPIPHPELCRRTDAWQAWVLGVDENGKTVAEELAYETLLCTGTPNSGKSVLMTNALLHAALDPAVPLFIYDPAGDLRPFMLCVAASGGSIAPGEGDTTKGIYRFGPDATDALEVMKAVEAEIERRHEDLHSVGLDEFTRKVNPYEMPVAVWAMEEWQTTRARCQSKAQRDLFDRTHMGIMLQHRKVAMVVLTVTQDPNWIEVPVPVRNEYSGRGAHRAPDAITSDVGLGHGKAEAGFSAAEIGSDQPGVCWFSLGGATPTKMRSYYPTDEEVVEACKFAADQRREYHGEPPAPAPAPVSEGVGGGSGVPGESRKVDGEVSRGGGVAGGGAGSNGSSGSSGGGGSEGDGGESVKRGGGRARRVRGNGKGDL